MDSLNVLPRNIGLMIKSSSALTEIATNQILFEEPIKLLRKKITIQAGVKRVGIN